MVVGIIFIIIATALIGIHFFVRYMDSKPVEIFQGSGTIDTMTHTDSGSAIYYVDFLHNGKEVYGESRIYPTSAKSKKPGDFVEFDYFLLNEKRARIVIHDERYVSPADKKPSYGLLITGIIILIIGVLIVYRYGVI